MTDRAHPAPTGEGSANLAVALLVPVPLTVAGALLVPVPGSVTVHLHLIGVLTCMWPSA